jgi:hypothetical protein
LSKTPIQFTITRAKPQVNKEKDKREGEEQEEEEREEEEQVGQGNRFYNFGRGYYGGWYGGWNYYPVVVTHSYYHSLYHGMGRVHPGHWHGVGGFAG